jgi:predicted NAD/FAD-binding protein
VQLQLAIVGGGVAGLTAGYLLHPRHHVTLLEQSNRLGGNAYTHLTRDGEELDIAVAAFGRAGYPNFYRLLQHLGIETRPCPSSYVSLHDLDTQQGIYLTPMSWRGLSRQRFEMFGRRTLMAVGQLFSGIKRGMRALARGELASLSVGEAIDHVVQFPGESRRLLLCTLCLMSSMDAAEVLAAPAEFFFSKLRVHNDVLSPKAVLSVRCVAHKTRSYIDALAAPFRQHIELGAGITRVVRHQRGVTIVDRRGKKREFDRVIFACSADQAFALLDQPSALERETLGKWKYKEGRVVVHRDYHAFPPRELMQAYTFLYTDRPGEGFRTSVNGSLWHLPGVWSGSPYVSSQHPNFPIRPELIDHEVTLRTPIFDGESCTTTRRIPLLNGRRQSYFCGSYFGYGLHEDAVSSAIAVARQLGAEW